MKKQLLFFAGLMLSLTMSAQDKLNLVVFSEDGEAFHAYVNGVQQNDQQQANVRIKDLSPTINLRIVFANAALPEIKKSMYLDAGFEHTVKIIRGKNMDMKLRYFGQVALGQSESQTSTAQAYNTAGDNTTQESQTTIAGGSSAVTSTTTTTTRTGNTNGENVSVNINMAGVGISMNVAGTDPTGTTLNTTSSTTVTSSGYVDNTYAEQAATPVQSSSSSSSGGCSTQMNASSFNTMKKTVESKPFSDTKMSTAKVATKNSCLSVNQVKEICNLFSMDDDKLTYAKYAYDYCVDKGNYYQVSDVFSFSSTTAEFNAFLEK